MPSIDSDPLYCDVCTCSVMSVMSRSLSDPLVLWSRLVNKHRTMFQMCISAVFRCVDGVPSSVFPSTGHAEFVAAARNHPFQHMSFSPNGMYICPLAMGPPLTRYLSLMPRVIVPQQPYTTHQLQKLRTQPTRQTKAQRTQQPTSLAATRLPPNASPLDLLSQTHAADNLLDDGKYETFSPRPTAVLTHDFLDDDNMDALPSTYEEAVETGQPLKRSTMGHRFPDHLRPSLQSKSERYRCLFCSASYRTGTTLKKNMEALRNWEEHTRDMHRFLLKRQASQEGRINGEFIPCITLLNHLTPSNWCGRTSLWHWGRDRSPQGIFNLRQDRTPGGRGRYVVS